MKCFVCNQKYALQDEISINVGSPDGLVWLEGHSIKQFIHSPVLVACPKCGAVRLHRIPPEGEECF